MKSLLVVVCLTGVALADEPRPRMDLKSALASYAKLAGKVVEINENLFAKASPTYGCIYADKKKWFALELSTADGKLLAYCPRAHATLSCERFIKEPAKVQYARISVPATACKQPMVELLDY
jgi:hypothetical protein